MGEETLAIYGAMLASIVVAFGVPLLAIFRENSELTMSRGPFIAWTALLLFALPVVLGIVADALPGLATYIVLLVAGACIIYVFFQRVVRRARDAGKGKQIAYLAVIPLVGMVVLVILMVIPSAGPGGAAQAAEA